MAEKQNIQVNNDIGTVVQGSGLHHSIAEQDLVSCNNSFQDSTTSCNAPKAFYLEADEDTSQHFSNNE